MQHDKKGDTRRALELLTTTDVAPQWRKEAAWTKLEAQIRPPARRAVSLWVYPLAAAIVLCVVVLYPRRPEHSNVVRIGHAFPVITKAAVLPVAKEEVRQIRPTTDERIVAIRKRPATNVNATEQALYELPQNGLENPTSVVPQREEELMPAVSQSPVVRRRAPEIVYTLNEILADVPEREAPPKRYTGIFRQRAASGASSSQTPAPSRKQIPPQGFELPAPIIIN